MKKQLLLLGALILCALFFSTESRATTVYAIDENFTAAPSPASWGFTGTTTYFTYGYDATNKFLSVRTSAKQKFFYTKSFTSFPKGDDNKIIVTLILKCYAACGNSSYNNGSEALYFRDSSGKPIFGVVVSNKGTATIPIWQLSQATTYEAGNPTLIPTTANSLTPDKPLAKVTAVLDMNTKTLSYDAQVGTYDYSTRIFTATGGAGNSISVTGVSFIDITAGTDVSSILANFFGPSTPSGTNGYDLIYTGISAEKSVADVTVNYTLEDGNAAKIARIASAQAVGTTFNAAVADYYSFDNNGFHYVYDANIAGNTTSVTVATGASINLKFKKTDIIAGTYTWTGATNSNWDDFSSNFTTDGNNSIAYQNGNAIVFGAEPSNKLVSLATPCYTGGNDVTFTADGYTLGGTESLNVASGTVGKINVNPGAGNTTTLNVINNLPEGVNIQSGTAYILNDASASKYTMADGSKIKLGTGSDFSKTISGTGTITIEAASNKIYTPTITGASTVNLILDNAGSVSSSAWTSQFRSIMPTNSQVNVTTTLASGAAGYAVDVNSLANSKLNLGDNTRLLYFYNPSSAASTIINIGELSGNASATVEGGWVNAADRPLSYSIGALNSDATYNGTFTNYTGMTLAPLNINKIGIGTWTLTGANESFNIGSFNVNAGKLVMNGSITSTAVPVTVATDATLGGNGTIGGATTVNGTIEGRLNFGSNLTLAGNTNLVVNGFGATQYDSIIVVGTINNGGVLNITVNAAAPAVNTSIKLIKAGAYAGSFTTVNIPSNYTFDNTTGVLTYTIGTELLENSSSNFKVYPTITRDLLHIEGANITSVQVLNLVGQTMKEIKVSTTETLISMNNMSNGGYLVKVRFADNSVKVQRVLLGK